MTEVQKVVQDVRLKEWVDIIQEQKASGLSVRAWCRENDIGQGRFYYWLNKLRKATLEQFPEELKKTTFVPIEPPINIKATNNINTNANSSITIRKGDISIELANDAPLSTITTVLEALQC